MSQQRLVAASDSELGTELMQEARSSQSYFSLLHRDLLNNVRLHMLTQRTYTLDHIIQH